MLKITQYLNTRTTDQVSARQIAKKFNTSNANVRAMLVEAIAANEITVQELPEALTGATVLTVGGPKVATPIEKEEINFWLSEPADPVTVSVKVYVEPETKEVDVASLCPPEEFAHLQEADLTSRYPIDFATLQEVAEPVVKPARKPARWVDRKMDRSVFETYATMEEALASNPGGIISIPNIYREFVLQGVSSYQMGRAIGGERARFTPRSPMWKPFLVGRTRYVLLSCVADIANLPKK